MACLPCSYTVHVSKTAIALEWRPLCRLTGRCKSQRSKFILSGQKQCSWWNLPCLAKVRFMKSINFEFEQQPVWWHWALAHFLQPDCPYLLLCDSLLNCEESPHTKSRLVASIEWHVALLHEHTFRQHSSHYCSISVCCFLLILLSLPMITCCSNILHAVLLCVVLAGTCGAKRTARCLAFCFSSLPRHLFATSNGKSLG